MIVKLARLVMFVIGIGLLVTWWWVLGHIMKSPVVWVDMLQWLGSCVLFMVAGMVIFAGMLYGRTVLPPKVRPQRSAPEPAPVMYRCERCESAPATLYSKKRDRLCCDACAFAGTLPMDDLTSVERGIEIRIQHNAAQRG